jgi:hypothetical protein
VTQPTVEHTRLFERVGRVYPLALAYVLLLTLYTWQTTKHSSPWLFTDELQWAEESRGIAHHGSPQLRGAATSFSSFYPYLIAPSWWTSTTSAGYSAAKYINAVVMAATLFPAYGLARLFVPRWAAAACGVAAAAIPALAYVGVLIPEPLAYFWSTLVLWLLARALVARSRATIAVSLAGLIVAPLIRSELAVLFIVAVVAVAVLCITSGRGRGVIRGWRPVERLGAVALVLAVAIYLGAILTHHSDTWRTGTYYHHRMFEYGVWAVGAFTIGVGVVPVVVALAWLLGNPFREKRERTLGGLLLGSALAFGVYTGVKASKLSTIFAIRVEERNFIYVAPLVFVALAAWAATARIRPVALLLSAGAVAYMLDVTPYHNTEDFYSDAPGLSVLQWLNRRVYFTTTDARRLLFGILVGTVVVVGVAGLLARRRRFNTLAIPASILLVVSVVGWNLWGEIAAADGSNRAASSFRNVLPTPPDWIDRTTGMQRTMFLGQSIGGSDAFWSLEFWNQSVQDIWSVDASAPGPGPTVTPDYRDATGVLQPQLPLDWIVATPGIDPSGKLVATVGGLRLFRVSHPIRLAAATGGLSADASWMSTSAFYIRFGSPASPVGTATVALSRAAACGGFPPSPITVRVRRLRINGDHQPTGGAVIDEQKTVIHSNPCDTKILRFRVRPPFRIDLSASRTFQPSQSDQRQLSAQVSFGFAPS